MQSKPRQIEREETASKQEHKYTRVCEAGGKCQMEERKEKKNSKATEIWHNNT